MAKEADAGIACDFDPNKVCPLKQSIQQRESKPTPRFARTMAKIYLLLDKADLAPVGVLNPVIDVVPDTCEEGPTRGVAGIGKACTAQVVFGDLRTDNIFER